MGAHNGAPPLASPALGSLFVRDPGGTRLERANKPANCCRHQNKLCHPTNSPAHTHTQPPVCLEVRSFSARDTNNARASRIERAAGSTSGRPLNVPLPDGAARLRAHTFLRASNYFASRRMAIAFLVLRDSQTNLPSIKQIRPVASGGANS